MSVGRSSNALGWGGEQAALVLVLNTHMSGQGISPQKVKCYRQTNQLTRPTYSRVLRINTKNLTLMAIKCYFENTFSELELCVKKLCNNEKSFPI